MTRLSFSRDLRPAIRWGAWGLSWLGWRDLRPQFEAWGPWSHGFWQAGFLGWSAWRNTIPGTTVGERGVW